MTGMVRYDEVFERERERERECVSVYLHIIASSSFSAKPQLFNQLFLQKLELFLVKHTCTNTNNTSVEYIK